MILGFMMSKIVQARYLAVFHHGDQRYGDFPYSAHLDQVVAVLGEFGYTDEVDLAAGYLHDVLEDTDLPYHDIVESFGNEVALIVVASTGIGKNRKERTTSILEKLKGYPRAAPVKAADRIANMRSSRDTRPDLYRMYQRELKAFIDVVEGAISPAMGEALREML